MPRLRDYYQNTVMQELQKQFNFSNVMAIPRLQKITLNMGLGEAAVDKKVLSAASSDMEKIAGQKPVITTARKSIANFKIRQGYPIGCKVTLRGQRMYEFLDRLISIVLPRVRDFRGLRETSFDGTGNYSLGITEQIVFPEIDYDAIDVIRGLDITISTTARNDEEAYALLKAFNFPFKNRNQPVKK